jgi:hypothetical protein
MDTDNLETRGSVMSIDVPTGIDEFLKAEGSTDAQRQDAVLVLAPLCQMTDDVCTLKATGEAIESEASRKWIADNKPHLLPPIYERSLAERAFIDGNLSARGALVKQVGMTEANKIAESYGLRSATDPRRGTAPTEPEGKKKKSEGAQHRNNPFHKSNWNISAQGKLLRAVGPEKCAAIANAVGSKIGATRPNPDF